MPKSKRKKLDVYVDLDSSESETDQFSKHLFIFKARVGKKSRSHFHLEKYLNEISKHRSCWLHMVASMHVHQGSLTKQEAEEISKFEFTSPCFLNFTPRRRSQRRGKKKLLVYYRRKKRKETMYVQTKKLDSLAIEHCIEKELVETKHGKSKKLDSSMFDNYIEKMWRSLSEEKKNCFTCLDCLWFSLYLKDSCKTKVLSWIKRKDIFSKKYVFVPIVCWRHWRLLIFCHFGESVITGNPCILLLDSLEMLDPESFEPDIRKFVLDIFQSEGRQETEEFIHNIPLLIPKVPQQTNGEECGKFVLYYMHLFMAEAPQNFSISDGYPYFMNKNWFTMDGLQRFCSDLTLP